MLTSRKTELSCSGWSFSTADLRKFAKFQKPQMKMSYLVASIPADVDTGCDDQEWMKSPKLNPNIATGALVGGPFKNDTFVQLAR
ncbi:hypothetical protein ABZP36_021390 [Zizania latifolia]